MMNLNAQALMDQAREVTGLSDFGEPSFRAGLDRLVASINKEAIATELGELAIPGNIVAKLINRLKIEECYRLHPEIDSEVIRDPVFITGLPRTGSTALGHMLALDQETRSLRGWEAAEPCPPPDITVTDDPRIARQLQNLADIDVMAPGLTEALPFNEHAPDECFFLLEFSLTDVAFNGFYHVPDYEDWAITEGLAEMDAAYQYHKRILKLLQWKTPARRWVLRSPIHALHMNSLLKVYPDSRFIITHRQPDKVLPSICSLIILLRNCFLQNPAPIELGVRQVNQWEEALRRIIRFRDELGEQRFFDIYHSEQTVNPEPGIRSLYKFLGWEFTDELANALQTWQQNNPKGSHKTDPSAFELNLDAIQKRFQFYTDRFGKRMAK